ncbi:MAG: cytochrome b N-terminal domain-containing protein [Phormidesmis sp.]
MSTKDVDIAGRVGEALSRFPGAWQNYQDWLGDIVASRSLLLDRYPTWQAVLIFRWRLLYFVGYVAVDAFLRQCLTKLKSVRTTLSRWKSKLFLGQRRLGSDRPFGNSYRYILQRTATLLAVAALTLCAIAAITGVLIAFNYQPAAMAAHESLTTIVNDLANGTLILSLHHVAGNGLIVISLVQLVVMFLGRELLGAWFTGWISGICLTLTAMGLSWTAIVLSWEQTRFWRFKIELGIVGSIPLVGSTLREILSGGSGISSLTLQHMYTLHSYVLAIAAVLLSLLHLSALILQEQHWKAERLSLSSAQQEISS